MLAQDNTQHNMGIITINILSQTTSGLPGNEEITSSRLTSTNCDSTWSVSAKTASSAWVEFTIPSNCTFTQTSPVASFTNGVTITGTWEWEFEITGFVSPNSVLNTTLTTVIARIYDFNGGSLLDTETINHYHSSITC